MWSVTFLWQQASGPGLTGNTLICIPNLACLFPDPFVSAGGKGGELSACSTELTGPLGMQ